MGSLSLFLKRHTIPFFVFVTGACILIIEILATRILAPYFGNTIFALSSVISVVLLALSLGYAVGGRLADKYPNEKLFYGIITVGGCCIIFLHLAGIIFLSVFGYSLSIVWGPIIASVLLFFAQNFLLGMLSPFAITLQARRQQQAGIGSVSGQIFFWSTLGSIFGSLSAGFFLIPHIGIDKIILGTGFVLIMLGGAAFLKMNMWYKVFLIVVVAAFFFFLLGRFSLQPKGYSVDGVYQKIAILDGQYKQQPARFLFLDRDASAATFINSNELAYDYTKYYALYKIFNPNVRQALMIGGGGYSVPKALLQDVLDVHIDVAEIEPDLFTLAQHYFNVPSDARLNNMVEDGRRLLADSSKKYDMMFSDAYSSVYSTPNHLTTREFFTLAKSKLNANGVFIANVIGSLAPGKDALALSEIKTFKSVFPNSYFFAVNSPNYRGLQNIIFCGYNSLNQVDVGSALVKNNQDPIISHLAQQEINLATFNFSNYPILTDDFAPIEYLTAKEL